MELDKIFETGGGGGSCLSLVRGLIAIGCMIQNLGNFIFPVVNFIIH